MERNSKSLLLFFSSTERNSEHFSPLRKGSEWNSGSFLFRGMVMNGIPRVRFYFCPMVQNSEHFYPLRNGSEQSSESFLFRGTAGIPPEQTNCSVYSVFLSEIANPSAYLLRQTIGFCPQKIGFSVKKFSFCLKQEFGIFLKSAQNSASFDTCCERFPRGFFNSHKGRC